jgi:hypothetical protein
LEEAVVEEAAAVMGTSAALDFEQQEEASYPGHCGTMLNLKMILRHLTLLMDRLTLTTDG